MTREEAIYRLKNTAWLGSDDDREEAEEAVVMAIKALEDIERWRTWSHTYDNLISRQDAIDSFGDEPEVWNDTEEEWAYRNAWVEHISAIKSLPSADAVEVVRCENCIFYEKALSVQGFCHNHGSIVSANAFCSYGSYGKRREDGEA